jgi:signal transduction histidine kinase
MAKRFLNKSVTRTRAGFFAAFFLLFVSYLLTYLSTRRVLSQNHWLNHNIEVAHHLDNVSSFIIRGESAFRGYILTGNKTFLADYDKSRHNTDSTMAGLKSLFSPKASQLKSIDTLSFLIQQKFLWIEKNLSLGAAVLGSPSVLKIDEDGAAKTKKIEAQIYNMKQTENKLWKERFQNVSQYSMLILVLNIISISIAILLTIYSLIVYNKENKEKQAASKKSDKYKEELQNKVNQLADLNTELIELRNLEKYSATGRIARVIAHEVRNPLTNINLATEQLLAEIENTDNTQMLISMINRNSERINQLVSDLLNSTRKSELTYSTVSLNDLLDQSISLAMDRIQLKQIKVVKNYEEQICDISVDVEKLKIVFLNIIVNAVEAMEDRGTLKLFTFKKEKKCFVQISDNGKGMTKNEIDRLFEPYFTTKANGNGLGLANSQNIVLSHRGSISGRSEEGKGTTFTITLPMD